MSSKNLREQKKEYFEHLFETVNEQFIQVFQQLYNDCLTSKEATPTTILKVFQKKLSEIPDWNQLKIQAIYEDIILRTKCNYFPDLVKTVYTLSIKTVLFGVKRPNMKIKIPTPELFIHRCLIHIARELWKRPYLLYHKARSIDCQNNIHHCQVIIRKKIATVIRETIPMDLVVSQVNSNFEEKNEEESVQETNNGESSADEESSTTEEDAPAAEEGEDDSSESEEESTSEESEESSSSEESEESSSSEESTSSEESEESSSESEGEEAASSETDMGTSSESESEGEGEEAAPAEEEEQEQEEEEEELVKEPTECSSIPSSDEEPTNEVIEEPPPIVKQINIPEKKKKKKDAFF